MKKSSNSSNIIQMWTDTDVKGITAACEYLSGKGKFKVTVSYKETKFFHLFKANFEPHFGMDVTDMDESQKSAEMLAKKLEKDFNIK